MESIEEFQKEKRNRIIFSNQSLEKYFELLVKYFKIKRDLAQQNKKLYLDQLKLFILENPDLYLQSDGIYASQNIQILNFEIDLRSWNKLFQKLFSVSTLGSYIYYGLLNALVETTKTFFDMDLANDKVLFYSCDSIEKVEFGMYFYLLYIAKKYEKTLCALSTPFQSILERVLQLDQKISTNTQNLTDDELEVKRFYDYMMYEYMNKNLYLFVLVSNILKQIIKQNEMFYNFNDQVLTIDPSLASKIEKCLLTTKNFTLIPLTLEFKDEETIHQNVILVDNELMIAERFEPHGSTRESSEKQMNSKLGLYFAKLGIEYIPHVCLKNEIQIYEHLVPDFLKGKCVTLSMDYLKYRVDSNLDRDKASLLYYEDVHKKGVYHWKEISEQNDKIFNEMQIYLHILNQTFKTSLKFSGTLLGFSS